MVRKLSCLIPCSLLVLALCNVQRAIEPVDGNEPLDAGELTQKLPNSRQAAVSAWTSMLIQNAESLEENLAECVASCDRTIKAAEEAGETSVAAVALMQRACATMGLSGIQHSDADFQAALLKFPDDTEDELRLLFMQALCFREQHTAPRHTHLIPNALKLELERLPETVDPAMRLQAYCDLLSYRTPATLNRHDVIQTARELLPAANRVDLQTRFEFLALKNEFQAEPVNGGIRFMQLADALLHRGGFADLPRSLKIELLRFNAGMQSRHGDSQTALGHLKEAQAEASILQNQTLIALCAAELSAITPSGAESLVAFRERQAAAGSLIPAINDAEVLLRLSRQLADTRSSAALNSETARHIVARLDTLRVQATQSANALNSRLTDRDNLILAKRSEQVVTERLRADAESRWSLLVARIGVVVFCCLAVILFRERWQLRRANRHLQSEILKNEQQRLEKERIELRLAKTERLESLGALAGGIAHDFSNLLVGVIGNADLLMHIEPASPMAKQCIEGIIRSAETAADLSRKMLAYAGKDVARKRIIDLNDLVDRMLPLLRAGVGGRHPIMFCPTPTRAATEVDPGQIEQVLLNLVTNASQAIGENHGKITIQTGIVTLDQIPVDIPTFGNRKNGGTFIWFEVSDTGPGIPESHLGRIFEPFFTTKQQSSGHGFGLAVVYGHVNRHDGLIQLQSSPGNGTCLRILLPHSSGLVSTDAAPLTDSAMTVESDFCSVVAVDDQAEVLDVIKRTFAASGATAHTFLTATEAMEFLSENNQVDCILLDMMMPVVDGSAMLEELMHRGNSIPVVVLSGYSSTNLGDFQRFPGVRAVVQKPFRPGDLLAVIRSVVPSASKTSKLNIRELQDSYPGQ